ncbi:MULTISPECIES: helix-turn-helix transcriptional regulator [unclassified Chelatococcus]|uniref:helix-turn-helix transcriptional regulator n=1 Tax=unclassified Chelatococcus TaxID=2638111 RepID=UPI001BD10999|nr:MULTISPECIES: helix-turn-helix transcriptional regulator [unclassified Chelatococcus]MBS7696219.1 helix-turn-helix transcriptional regulator [Chelatococcus sp. YT9]MBX3557754.1 helix-turn-helix transcriptional regulator [Chelatococcus sp.]
MSEDATLTDRIYEAAFVPELWPDVLEGIAAISGSVSGSILVFDNPDLPPRYKTTALTEASLQAFVTTDQWQQSRRIPFYFPELLTGRYARFFYVHDLLAPEQISKDSVEKALQQLALGEQITTIIPMPTREVVSYTFERRVGEGRHEAEAIALLDQIRPHAARAGMISARLGLERAQATVSTLEALGIPAAVLTRTGKVRATNGLLDSVNDIVLPIAFGGLAIASAPANKLFQDAIVRALDHVDEFVWSIPVPARDDQPARVVHVLPLLRTARDLLFGADILVAITKMHPGNLVPSSPILMGLFDLTPSEARIAAALASGKSLRQAASEMGLSFGSARTYLAHIFTKTGTNQQSQLVSLLKSSQPIAPL